MNDDEFFPVENDEMTASDWAWVVGICAVWPLTLVLFILVLAGAVFLA